MSFINWTYLISPSSSAAYIFTTAENSSSDKIKLTVAKVYLNYFGDTLFLPNLSQS